MQADIAGLFGVKLRRENIFKLKGGGDLFAVVGRRRDDFFVVGHRVIAVDEIKIRRAAQAREKFRVAEADRVPAHVRNF